MFPLLKKYCDNLITQFSSIPDERKKQLEKIANYVKEKNKSGNIVQLMYICTHNSRRSHFGQIWAQASAHYYDIKNVYTYSGGTEATAFNINAINALKRTGFTVDSEEEGSNPIYFVAYDEESLPCVCFSKVHTHVENPSKQFAAIMTCSDADTNCPVLHGMDIRIATTYDDPKSFDGTEQQDAKYDERCKQIALESLYVFSKIK